MSDQCEAAAYDQRIQLARDLEAKVRRLEYEHPACVVVSRAEYTRLAQYDLTQRVARILEADASPAAPAPQGAAPSVGDRPRFQAAGLDVPADHSQPLVSMAGPTMYVEYGGCGCSLCRQTRLGRILSSLRTQVDELTRKVADLEGRAC